MTDVTPKPRARARTLKTWSAFGNLGRRPTEYEIVTHNMNHTNGAIPLEMGPDVHGNVWLRKHRDSMRLKVEDWDAFRDPDSVTYGTYVAGQDDQETYVEGLLEQFDNDGYDEALSAEALALLFRVLTPSRYLAHGQQMLSAYLQQLAVSSYVSNCAAFQTADQLRRVQLTSYRTTQLRLTHEGDAQGERRHWEGSPDWQGIRKVVELALVEFDWDRAFVITNLVLKPLADLITIDQLSAQASAVGATLDSLVLENLYRDSLRSQRWTSALVTFLTGADPANRDVLQEYLDEFAPLAEELITSGVALLSTPGGQSSADIEAAVRSGWAGLLEPLGLRTIGS
ncbi:MAG TPA: toluene hydroxylase [Nocardioidaceae bacterium]|nr:toluene hydroxylase [Nocardioidaceae bacterium]